MVRGTMEQEAHVRDGSGTMPRMTPASIMGMKTICIEDNFLSGSMREFVHEWSCRVLWV